MQMKPILSAVAVALLAGCGGGGTPADIAAKACDAQVQQQVQDQPYQLDLTMLASSMKDDGRGGHLLTVPVTVNLGLADQSVQVLECSVRITGEPPTAEVLNVRFIW